MRVEIMHGGNGVMCWNAEAISAYAASVDAREAQLVEANPDLVVTPGRVKCYGCRELEFDVGFSCTAELTRTLYSVAGEVAPRAADAAGSLSDITGLRSRIEVGGDPEQPAPAHPSPTAAPATPTSGPATPTSGEAGSNAGAPVPPRAPVAPVPPAAPQRSTDRRSTLSRILGRRG